MTGGYFEADIDGRAVDMQFHALGPVKRAPLKCPGFAGDVYAPHGRAFPLKLGLTQAAQKSGVHAVNYYFRLYSRAQPPSTASIVSSSPGNGVCD
jgi:hypothetical protein